MKSEYPNDWQLENREIVEFEKQIDEGLCTTNGDTSPVTITARQLILLLERSGLR